MRPLPRLLLAALLVTGAGIGAASARSLAAIEKTGTLSLCANPNALPYSGRHPEPAGFQIDLGNAIAKQLGVEMTPIWIIGPRQIRRAGCDMVLDVIADPAAEAEIGLKVTKPYYRTGTVVAVRGDSPVSAVSGLSADTKVGVKIGSPAFRLLDKRGVRVSSFGFEDEMMQALNEREIDGAAVNPASAGYFSIKHPDAGIRVLRFDENTPDLSWNVAVGLLQPDQALIQRMESVVDTLRQDGTVNRIYAAYGITLQPPR